jgi:hypothetical protein
VGEGVVRVVGDEDDTQLAEDYETGDASAEMERADYDDSTTAEPMVTTSLRLPNRSWMLSALPPTSVASGPPP